MVTLTNHASQRIKERVGLPKTAVKRNAEKALEHGLEHKQMKGSIRRFIDALYLHYRTANNIRVYGNSVYLFHNNVLITVIDLPPKYRKTVANILAKERQK